MSRKVFDYTRHSIPHVYFAIMGDVVKIGFSNTLTIKRQVSRNKGSNVVIFKHDNPRELVNRLKKKYFSFQLDTKKSVYYSCMFESANIWCRKNGAIYYYPFYGYSPYFNFN
jgi:hypothetical protein